jgi:hypothetical protein
MNFSYTCYRPSCSRSELVTDLLVPTGSLSDLFLAHSWSRFTSRGSLICIGQWLTVDRRHTECNAVTWHCKHCKHMKRTVTVIRENASQRKNGNYPDQERNVVISLRWNSTPSWTEWLADWLAVVKWYWILILLCCLFLTGYFLRLLFDPEDGAACSCVKVGELLTDYKASNPRW